MKIVIDISENDYWLACNYPETLISVYAQAIKNGTPLPKGHGRLIDADALEKKMCDREEELADDIAVWESSAVSVALSAFAPTIVEGEKE